MRQILVSGSTAYDTHLKYAWDFSKYFLSDIESWLNLSLVASEYERHNGWTGANIAYNLALLWEHAILLSAIGEDFTYEGTIKEKCNLKYIHKNNFLPIANSFIFSDSEDHRMTLFHPGVSKEASASKISFVQEDIWIAIVSANHIPTMLEHARELKARNIPFFADPAQQITQMTHDELRELVNLADYLILNHHELRDLQSISWFTEEDLVEKLSVVIVTYGDQGSQLLELGSMIHIPAIAVEPLEDTTGAGDAYRAWVLKARIEGYDWKTACQLWTLLASYCIITEGAQNHHFSYSLVAEDMQRYFGVEMDLYNKRKY